MRKAIPDTMSQSQAGRRASAGAPPSAPPSTSAGTNVSRSQPLLTPTRAAEKYCGMKATATKVPSNLPAVTDVVADVVTDRWLQIWLHEGAFEPFGRHHGRVLVEPGRPDRLAQSHDDHEGEGGDVARPEQRQRTEGLPYGSRPRIRVVVTWWLRQYASHQGGYAAAPHGVAVTWRLHTT